MKKTLLILVLSTVLYSCVNEAKEVSHDGEFEIEFLFEKDGCKMYRFKDGTRYIYWSTCQGNTQYNYTVHHGKTSHTEHIEQITDTIIIPIDNTVIDTILNLK